MFAAFLDCPHPDFEASELWKMTLEHREQLILLDPDSKAEGIDHEFQSPTFKEPLTDHIEDYINKNGEYP